MIIEQYLNWDDIKNDFPTLRDCCVEVIKGEFTNLSKQPYKITAALYNYEDGVTILAIMGVHYSKDNPCWYTIKIPTSELRDWMKKFRLISEDEQKERWPQWTNAYKKQF